MNKQKGKVIFLNGLTSTGKTSMCKELISRKKHSFFVLGYDMFEEAIPEWSYTEARYANAIIAMYHAARSLSDQGQDVIIDGLIMQMEGLEHHYDELKKIFEGYPLIIVNVHCSLELLRERNIARGDRRENQSEEQSKKIVDNIDFYCSIDSGRHTVTECVDLLLNSIELQEI